MRQRSVAVVAHRPGKGVHEASNAATATAPMSGSAPATAVIRAQAMPSPSHASAAPPTAEGTASRRRELGWEDMRQRAQQVRAREAEEAARSIGHAASLSLAAVAPAAAPWSSDDADVSVDVERESEFLSVDPPPPASVSLHRSARMLLRVSPLMRDTVLLTMRQMKPRTKELTGRMNLTTKLRGDVMTCVVRGSPTTWPRELYDGCVHYRWWPKRSKLKAI